MNKILVTGFDPFNKETINPSYEAVKLLKDKIKDFRVIKRASDRISGFFGGSKQNYR